MKDSNVRLSLNIYLNQTYIPLVTTFVEESAKACGLDRDGAIKLTLAGEEIFVYLCQAGRPDEPITVEARDGKYYVQVRFLFQDHGFDPRAFNITAQVSFDDPDSLNEMGLLIAARTVDRFHIAGIAPRKLELVLTKEKSYPELADLNIPATKPGKSFVLKTPEPESLKLFSRLAAAYYPGTASPTAFRLPGKIVDMVSSGEYGATLAMSEAGHIGGGILWRWVGDKMVESFGPYLFHPPSGTELAADLLNACLGRITKTTAIGLLHRYATPELPRSYFESIGTVDFVEPDGMITPQPVYYRQLNEDLGCQVWTHPDLEDFLRAFYGRLYFAREIRLTRYGGEQRPAHSVFAPEFDRANGQVTLRAIWDGADIADNLVQHVKVFKAENLRNIFFTVDLALAWQANLIPALLANKFLPRLILPYGGEADVVVFQYREG